MIFPDLSEEDIKEVEKMELKDKVLDKMRKKRGPNRVNRVCLIVLQVELSAEVM